MKRLILTITMVLSLGFTASVNAYVDGNATIEVKGAYANDTWTELTIENIKFGYPDFDGDGKWYGLVTVEPNATGCPTNLFDGPINNVWSTGFQTSPTTVQSGPQPYPLGGAYGQRLCFYVVQMRANGAIDSGYMGAQLLQVKPAAPDPGMTKGEATIIAKSKLAKKYGKSWRKGTSRKVTCRPLSTIFNCKASWRYGGKPRTGSVIVKK